jgi:cell division protein FtsQ
MMSTSTLETQTIKVDFTDRYARRRRRWRIALVVLTAVLIVVAVWVVWFSSILAVKVVRVVGADGPQAAAVLSAAQVPLGVPVARVDADGAQAAVLALQWVSSAEIRRGWPNEIVIAVRSRVPMAVDAASRQAVDSDGVVFDAAGTLPRTLPKVAADGVGLEAAMAVLASLPADVSGKVESMSATTRDDVDLVLRSGARVHWGSAEQAEFKVRVLRALLRQKKDVYDVTAPELPTTFAPR